MSDFSLGTYPQSSLAVVYSDREEIEIAPDYQRISGIWTQEKRQLLLDSLLNGFDVPKLYFHEFVPPKKVGGKTYRYAIIDGKQRLETIWSFIDGHLPLDEDFRYFKDPKVEAGGLAYQELGRRYPHLKNRFDATSLTIVTVRTNDIELIEDMFSRLNEAVPLNAAEKRSALGGPLPVVIKRLSKHSFFTENIPFSDSRYRHRDLATKFLYLGYLGRIANTKKSDLDSFVREFKKQRSAKRKSASPAEVKRLVSSTKRVLNQMASVFGMADSLLRPVGMVTLYYHLYREVEAGRVTPVSRSLLVNFEKRRAENRKVAEETGESSKSVDSQLLEFERHSQTPNDAYAIRERFSVMLKFLQVTAKVKVAKAILAREEQ